MTFSQAHVKFQDKREAVMSQSRTNNPVRQEDPALVQQPLRQVRRGSLPLEGSSRGDRKDVAHQRSEDSENANRHG